MFATTKPLPPVPQPEPLLVDGPGAQRLLSLSKSSIYLLTKAGKLPHVRIGRSVRYSPADLAKWVAANAGIKSGQTGRAAENQESFRN